MAEVRHVAGSTIGLEIVEPVPVDLFREDRPVRDEPLSMSELASDT